ncbi:MAG TPA: M1 family aminopeptidase [Candidatus Polarisedimenticolaceae bacterium]|nr:M1 family aminopeptidase [Candidatus Polarisedimenticolaceae bacterium]
MRNTMRVQWVVGALLGAWVGSATGALAAAESPAATVQEGITVVLHDKVSKLLASHDKDGNPDKRGTYSQTYKKVDAGTYQATFHVDTIEPTTFPLTQQLKTERYLLTLKGSGGNWSIANEELKDTYIGLFRGDFAPDLYKFDKLTWDKEGLKLSASNGYLYTYVSHGSTVAFRVFADDLTYDFVPPSDTGYYGAIRNKIFKDHPQDIVFKTDWADIACDPATCNDFMKSIFSGLDKTTSGTGGAWSNAKSDLASSQSDMAATKSKNPFGVFTREREIARKYWRENSYGGFARVPEADRRFWQVEFHTKTAGKERFVDMLWDNWAPWQVTMYATDYGRQFDIPLFGYYDEATRKGSTPPYLLEQRDDLDARDFDLAGLDAKVEIGLDEPDSLVGDVTYQINMKRDLRELPFAIPRSHIAGATVTDPRSPKLFVNSVQDGDGNELTWVKEGALSGLIIFPKMVPAGTKLTLRLQFENLDSISRLNPSYASLDREGWLPLVRFGDFIDTFHMTTRLPAKYEILGIGKKVSENVQNDVRTTVWGSDSPVTFPTIIFGEYISDDAGKYEAKKSDGTVIPVRVYVDKVSTQGISDQEGFNGGARDIRGKQLGAIATQAAVALNYYKDLYGADYPFAKLDLVADPNGFLYGQSPASIVYLGFGVFRGEGTIINATDRNASQISKFNRDVVAHEVGHQWWGGLITNANQRNYWFVESMAELSAALYVETTAGKKKYLDKVADWRQVILGSEPDSNVQSGYTMWGGSLNATQANIYNKGPYAFHIFRSTFGDDKFFALLKEMTKELQHKEIVTRDMQDVMEKVVGGNMDWFFDQWVRGVGLPQYAINWTKRKNEQGKWIVEGTIKQRVVFGKDKVTLKDVYYRGVAPLSFVDLNGKETKSAKPLLVQGPETPFRVIVPDEPEKVYFNKDGEILAEDLVVNTSW